MNFHNKQEEWVTLPDGAALLGITPYRLRKAVMRGEILSKRCTESPRSHFRFTEAWLRDYGRTLTPPSVFRRMVDWLKQLWR